MTVKTYDKDGSVSNCFINVENITLLFITGRCKEALLNLKIKFKDGSELDYYLSEHERFATITEQEEK